MSILVDETTRVIIQGATGRHGRYHMSKMLDYGVQVVAGIGPGKGGQTVLGVPIYDTVAEAAQKHSPDTAMVMVPPAGVLNAAAEAIASQIPLLVIITEHVPFHDALKVRCLAEAAAVKVIGPNTVGVISPGKCKVGVSPVSLFSQGPIGLISRSGTLTHEVACNLTDRGIGQSTCVGIGGDMLPCFSFVDTLELFEKDTDTEGVVVIGEVGGISELEAAQYIREKMKKPVFAVIAGINAPPGKKMGHAGAIVMGERTTAASKIEALTNAGVSVIENILDLPEAIVSKL